MEEGVLSIFYSQYKIILIPPTLVEYGLAHLRTRCHIVNASGQSSIFLHLAYQISKS